MMKSSFPDELCSIINHIGVNCIYHDIIFVDAVLRLSEFLEFLLLFIVYKYYMRLVVRIFTTIIYERILILLVIIFLPFPALMSLIGPMCCCTTN